MSVATGPGLTELTVALSANSLLLQVFRISFALLASVWDCDTTSGGVMLPDYVLRLIILAK